MSDFSKEFPPLANVSSLFRDASQQASVATRWQNETESSLLHNLKFCLLAGDKRENQYIFIRFNPLPFVWETVVAGIQYVNGKVYCVIEATSTLLLL